MNGIARPSQHYLLREAATQPPFKIAYWSNHQYGSALPAETKCSVSGQSSTAASMKAGRLPLERQNNCSCPSGSRLD
jgi:hypothetical protein